MTLWGQGMLIFSAVLFLLSCSKNNPPPKTKFGIFTVLEDRTTIEMEGIVGSTTLDNFNQIIRLYPDIDLIKIKHCDGSDDDEVNLKVSLKVHSLKINTHILDGGVVASGGTDFFLAGIKRSIGSNVQIGVHSWWAGYDNNGKIISATDFPIGHERHQPYIQYYMSVGFTLEEAEDFYYFTINAATAENIHWMTDEEIKQYGILD